jgi:hypothetical protein
MDQEIQLEREKGNSINRLRTTVAAYIRTGNLAIEDIAINACGEIHPQEMTSVQFGRLQDGEQRCSVDS